MFAEKLRASGGKVEVEVTGAGAGVGAGVGEGVETVEGFGWLPSAPSVDVSSIRDREDSSEDESPPPPELHDTEMNDIKSIKASILFIYLPWLRFLSFLDMRRMFP
jgi:hypothetical protein